MYFSIAYSPLLPPGAFNNDIWFFLNPKRLDRAENQSVARLLGQQRGKSEVVWAGTVTDSLIYSLHFTASH
jgi:hypothetical protein